MMKLNIGQRPSGANLRSIRTRFVQHGDAAPATRIKATFSIKRRVNYGESLAIIGENAELGGWKVAAAKKLTWGEGDVWQGEVELDAGQQVQYKYLIVDKHGKNVVWLPGENFILSIPEATSDMISIQDSWDGADRRVIIDENKGVAPSPSPSPSPSASSSVAPTILDATHGLAAAPEGATIEMDQAAGARPGDGQVTEAPPPLTIGKLEITVEAGSALPFTQNGNGNGNGHHNGNGNGNGHHAAATAVAEAGPATIEAVAAAPAAPAMPHTAPAPAIPQESESQSEEDSAPAPAPGPRNTLSGQEIASLPSLTVRELRALAEKLGVEHSGVGKNLLLRRVQNKIRSML